MKRFALSLLFLLSSICFAQTTYTQTQPSNCALADYVCNGIPLGGGLVYGFQSGSGYLSAGAGFYIGSHYGTISKVLVAPPPLRDGNSGPFSFTYSTKDNHNGKVSGSITVLEVHSRYVWPYAVVESSTVTFW